MERGSASLARRWRRNVRMRRAMGGSSRARSFLAPESSSTVQAKVPFHFVQREYATASGAEGLQAFFGEVQVFQVFQVQQDGLAGVEGLGAPGTLGEPGKALFDGFGEPNGQHKQVAIQV